MVYIYVFYNIPNFWEVAPTEYRNEALKSVKRFISSQ